MKLLKFIPALTILALVYSCNSLKIATAKKNISELAIEWNFTEKVNPTYVPLIDSVFGEIITRFNNEHHSFTIHKRAANEDDYVAFTFNKGKFVSKAGVTAGYITSAVGLLATPIIVYAASSGTFIALFYYFPADKMDVSIYLSPSLSDKKNSVTSSIHHGALFSNKTKRIQKITSRLDVAVYEILLDLEKQTSSK